MSAAETRLLQARYTAVEGSDPEYAQGAIEKNDVAHAEVAHFVFVIQVDANASCEEWQQKLNAAVDARFGSFRVEPATADEESAVRAGSVTLQR